MSKKSRPIRAYHFVGKTLRDGRPIPADGVWLEHEGPLVMCQQGLHASRRPADALKYAPGSTLCLVELDGEVIEEEDKIVARRRRIIARIDAEPLLWDYARWCALQAVHLWDSPDVVKQYLNTGDESLRSAARDAARDAARAAAGAAAGAAARAAWAAAGSAAVEAAGDAAGAAAWAAWAAAGSAAVEAAWAAAGAAAWDAARAAQRKHLLKLVRAAFKKAKER